MYSVVQKRNHKSELKNEQRNLEQNPEHRDYRTYRHRHHLRGDFVHGRVNNKRAQNGWVALSLLVNNWLSPEEAPEIKHGNKAFHPVHPEGVTNRGGEGRYKLNLRKCFDFLGEFLDSIFYLCYY